MFEEVPRSRRGLATYLGAGRLTARRIVLGPFVIGGGVVLAAVGGSVAVAATVFTASTIRASDLPPRHDPVVVSVSTSAGRSTVHPHPHSEPATSQVASSVAPASPVPPVRTRPSAPVSTTTSSAVLAPVSPSLTTSTTGSRSTTASSPSATGSLTASGTPTATPSPAGNATVYVSGWNVDRKALVFEFATVSKGTGPQQSDVYAIGSSRQYTATLAADLRIVSGGQLCPPAGSLCTVDQLIAGTAQGFFAELAVDPTAAVHQVSERDNLTQFAPPKPPTPTPTPTPTSTAPPGLAPVPTGTPTSSSTATP